jgi:hypothetical protein
MLGVYSHMYKTSLSTSAQVIKIYIFVLNGLNVV